MLIDSDLLRFCAEKTREVAVEHDKACGAAIGKGLPRSAEDLHWILMERHGFPIYHKVLNTIPWTKAKFRSFYIPYGEKGEKLAQDSTKIIKNCWIFYANGMSDEQLRFYKTKELLQIHLWQEAHATRDIVGLVQNMILRESPTALDLDLGHSTTSDTLGEVAAMEFLFPLEHRLAYLKAKPGNDGVAGLAAKYQIPEFVVGRALFTAESLKEYFCPDAEAGDAKK